MKESLISSQIQKASETVRITVGLAIDLVGEITFEQLTDTLMRDFDVKCRILRADLDFMGAMQFGELLIFVEATELQYLQVINYVHSINLRYKLTSFNVV